MLERRNSIFRGVACAERACWPVTSRLAWHTGRSQFRVERSSRPSWPYFRVGSRRRVQPLPKQETVQPPSAEDGSILSVTHEARLFDILLALAWRPVNAAFVLLGLGVVAVSIRNTTIAPGPGYDPQSYWPFVGFASS